ncbi:peptidase [Geothrix oryzae]|uniref:Peptidase n=2 Tax=Geothrix oryzae TaxID=2927975 RepID=A0ABN6UVL9_9BACT|nr:peptidase [Geothrix oryzae]
MHRCFTGFCVFLLLGPMARSQTPPLRGEAYRLAEESYRLQAAHDLAGALSLVDAALAKSKEHPQLLALKRDLLYAIGSLPEADALNEDLLAKAPGDAKLRLFRIYLRQRQGRLAEALEDATQLEGDSGISPGDRRQTRLVLADLFQAQGRHTEALKVLMPHSGEAELGVQARRAFLLLADGHHASACQAFQDALQLSPDADQRRTLLQGLCDAARKTNQADLELRALEDLRRLNPQDRHAALELAYAYVGRHRDAEALDHFSAGLDDQSLPGTWLDAAYAAKRLGKNSEAVRYFTRGMDARRASGQTSPEFDYGLRREVETLSRSWGLASGSFYRQSILLPGVASRDKLLQQGLEAYWQPEFLAQNGRMVQVFAQVFENLYSGNSATTGGPTLQGVVGVRAKPFSSENVVFTAEKLVALGRLSLNDWMFRAAYSADAGLDLRPWERDWNYWRLFTEGAAFAKTGQYVHQLEVRAGHAWRMKTSDGRDMLAPHLVLAGDFDNRVNPRYAGGFGIGASLRHWFREDRHHAPASWLELTLQARAQLGSADRGKGLFLTLTGWF